MQTKFELRITDARLLPSLLTEIITKHNNGESNVDIDIIECYCLATKAAFPSLWENATVEQNTQTKTVAVYNKEEIVFSIKEKEVYDFKESIPTLERNMS